MTAIRLQYTNLQNLCIQICKVFCLAEVLVLIKLRSKIPDEIKLFYWNIRRTLKLRKKGGNYKGGNQPNKHVYARDKISYENSYSPQNKLQTTIHLLKQSPTGWATLDDIICTVSQYYAVYHDGVA